MLKVSASCSITLSVYETVSFVSGLKVMPQKQNMYINWERFFWSIHFVNSIKSSCITTLFAKRNSVTRQGLIRTRPIWSRKWTRSLHIWALLLSGILSAGYIFSMAVIFWERRKAWAWSLIRNKNHMFLLRDTAMQLRNSEAITCARRCQSSWLTRWWTQKE
jgi:hypothetical protein